MYKLEGWTRHIFPSYEILFNQCHHFIFWSHRWICPIPMNWRYSKLSCQRRNTGNIESQKLIFRLLIVYVSIFDWFHSPRSPKTNRRHGCRDSTTTSNYIDCTFPDGVGSKSSYLDSKVLEFFKIIINSFVGNLQESFILMVTQK